MGILANTFKALVHQAGHWYIQRLCSVEFSQQTFRHHNERPIEYRFALEGLTTEKPRAVLDVGTGTTAWPHILRNCGFVVTAIDNVRDYWERGLVNRHWTVLDVDITRPNGFNGTFDAVTCISVLEHIKEPRAAISNISTLLNPGGILILTTPFSYHHPDPNVYLRPDALYGKKEPYICRSSANADLSEWLSCGFELVRHELWQLFDGPVWATGERCEWRKATTEEEPHQLGCFVLRRR